VRLVYDAPETKEQFAAMIAGRGYKVGAEIGIRAGDLALPILRTGAIEKYYMIDPWKHQDEKQYWADVNFSDEDFEKLYREVLKKIEPYKHIAVVMRMFSSEAIPRIPDESLDWGYIDGNHGYKYALKDLMMLSKKVKPGHMIAGHDLLDYEFPHRFGVKTAVRKFFPEDQVVHTSRIQWPLWWTLKP